MKISELFKQIKETAGTNAKAELMKKNLNETIISIFNDTYDNQRKYYVHKFNKDLPVGKKTIDDNYPDFRKVLNILTGRVVTGNAAIELLENTIAEFDKPSQEICCQIIDRNLKIGLSNELFAKILGKEARKDFEVTLAQHLEKVKGVNHLDGTWYASRKIDGCVSGDTIVELMGGRKKTIKEIVDKKIKGKIKSFDTNTKQIVYKEIEDWMHNVEDINPSQKQWYEITLENNRKIKITGNDSLYVKDKGWTKVENLTENDEIITEFDINNNAG